jgi:oligopeptide/dipeptide ABC transporter ATP-binding protein
MTETSASSPLFEFRGLSVAFPTARGTLRAVNDVDLSVREAETVGVVGESGSGKTTVFLAAMGLLSHAHAAVAGEVLFRGRDLLAMDERELRKIRGRHIAMIFQDPMSSLHPLHTVGWQVAEALTSHLSIGQSEASTRTIEALREVGLPNPPQCARQYPHELSGGMRQRVMIAMALALRPSVVIADEPTTALDVTVQAQILELLDEVRSEIGAATILITHDLSIIAERTQRTVVMYAGRVVEQGETDAVFSTSQHPYTKALLESIPRHDVSRQQRLKSIPGAPPSGVAIPPGCPFHPRCTYAEEVCEKEVPQLRRVAGHDSACHFAERLSTSGVLEASGEGGR